MQGQRRVSRHTKIHPCPTPASTGPPLPLSLRRLGDPPQRRSRFFITRGNRRPRGEPQRVAELNQL
jgi:hypothetical protein